MPPPRIRMAQAGSTTRDHTARGWVEDDASDLCVHHVYIEGSAVAPFDARERRDPGVLPVSGQCGTTGEIAQRRGDGQICKARCMC